MESDTVLMECFAALTKNYTPVQSDAEVERIVTTEDLLKNLGRMLTVGTDTKDLLVQYLKDCHWEIGMVDGKWCWLVK
jgi:hypothetical protein